MNAEFSHGNPTMIDHTPGSAVAAGAVIVINDSIRIAHLDIAASTIGALAARGGIYKVPKTTGGSTAIAAGKLTYWDAGASVVTTNSNSGANKQFGPSVNASIDADAFLYVEHDPV